MGPTRPLCRGMEVSFADEEKKVLGGSLTKAEWHPEVFENGWYSLVPIPEGAKFVVVRGSNWSWEEFNEAKERKIAQGITVP